MSRPFLEAYYDQEVPRQLLLNKPVYCAPFPKQKAAYARLPFIKVIAYKLYISLANIIISKLALFSSRFVAKVVLDGSPSMSFDGDSLSICVDWLRTRTRTRTRTGSEPPLYQSYTHIYLLDNAYLHSDRGDAGRAF